MKKIYFLFGIHNHQPVGNFDDIVAQAFARAYAPFLKLLTRYPAIKATLHFSGPLLEWMDAHDAFCLDAVHGLVSRGQVELLSGGMYEPVFSMLREADVLGQVRMMNESIRTRFNAEPAGGWVAERVWDPVLPRLLNAAGLTYTLLDSTHFLHAGLAPEQIRGYYVTEREGKSLAVFPIDMKLRYAVPFEPPEKTIAYLQYRASENRPIAVSYCDDGEKFGLWPGTYDWVYERGWLESFFKLLEQNRAMIHTMTCSEYLAAHPSEGPIYLPALAYDEMMEWALPSEAVIRYGDMLHNLQDLGLKEKYAPFLCGGYWNNFLVKYPESNQMHKKMLLVSERLEEACRSGRMQTGSAALEEARRELYRGQCNCPYWHGLFGGIYLNCLRHAVYTHLINAEKIIDAAAHDRPGPWITCREFDFKRDFSRDVLVAGSSLNAFFSPRDGGGLFELDFNPRSFNLMNVLTRRMEGYHRRLKCDNGTGPAQGRQPVSIHALSRVKEEGLQNILTYDWYQRHSFIDHFLDPGTTPEGFSLSRYTEMGDFIEGAYSLERLQCDEATAEALVVLRRDGTLLLDDQELPLRVTKEFRINDAAREINALYTLENLGPRDVALWFGIEFNITLLAGEDPLRYFHMPGGAEEQLYMNSRTTFPSISAFAAKDDWNGFGMGFALPVAAELWMFPLETVSQSEDGLEKTYQGSMLLLSWKMNLPPAGREQREVRIALYEYESPERRTRP